MKQIASIHRRLVEEKAPAFARAIQEARLVPGDRRAPVVTSMEEFPEQDMSLVYACLWYASAEGVPVTFVPPDGAG